MPINKDDIQDDYYANISQSTENDAWAKKVLKIKPKVILKKSSEWVAEPTEEPALKPKIIARKVEKTEEPVAQSTPEPIQEVERPKAFDGCHFRSHLTIWSKDGIIELSRQYMYNKLDAWNISCLSGEQKG